MGIAHVSIDGGSATTVDEYSAVRNGDNLVYAATGLSTGAQHTMTVYVTGTKNASSSAYWVAVDRAQVIPCTVDDTVTGSGVDQFNYGSGFLYGGETDHGGRYNASNHYTTGGSTPSATFYFLGTGIEFFGTISRYGGYGTVKIDGGATTTINQYYNDEPHGNQLEYVAKNLTYGYHTLTMTALGTAPSGALDTEFAIDRVNVLG